MSTAEKRNIVIASAENRIFKSLKKTVAADGPKKEGRTLVSGAKLVREVARLLPERCSRLIVYDGWAKPSPDAAALLEQFAGRGELVVLKKALFNELDLFQTGSPLLEVAVPPVPPWDGSRHDAGCVLALPFQDPVNVGSAVRSAAAFGVSCIVLLREAAHPFHPKSIRASGGAVFRTRFFRGPALARLEEHLAQPALPVVSLDMHGLPLQQFSFPESFLLLPGTEGQGLPAHLRARAIAIPMSGAVESLNAATAVSIVLFYWRAGLGKKLTKH